MPVIRKRLAPVSSVHSGLVRKLVAELRRNATTGLPTAPVVREDEQRGNYLHVTVIWDAWRRLGPEERGRMIMDAYERARPDDVLRITVAMGLTHAEAERLGVSASPA